MYARRQRQALPLAQRRGERSALWDDPVDEYEYDYVAQKNLCDNKRPYIGSVGNDVTVPDRALRDNAEVKEVRKSPNVRSRGRKRQKLRTKCARLAVDYPPILTQRRDYRWDLSRQSKRA